MHELNAKNMRNIQARVKEVGGLARIFVDEAQGLGSRGIEQTGKRGRETGKQNAKNLKCLVEQHLCPIHFISATPLSTSKSTDVDNVFTYMQIMGFHPFTSIRGKQLWEEVRKGLPEEVLANLSHRF